MALTSPDGRATEDVDPAAAPGSLEVGRHDSPPTTPMVRPSHPNNQPRANNQPETLYGNGNGNTPPPAPTSSMRRPHGQRLAFGLPAFLGTRRNQAVAFGTVVLVVVLFTVFLLGGGEDNAADPSIAPQPATSGAAAEPGASASPKPVGRWTLVVGDEPLGGLSVSAGVEVSLVPGTESLDGVERVRFSLDGDNVLSDREAPFTVKLDQLTPGSHVLSARVRIDETGDEGSGTDADSTDGSQNASGTSNPNDIEAQFTVGGEGGAEPTRAPAVAAPPAAVTSVPPAPPPLRTVRVSNADQLTAALADARPGDLVQLADGVYEGNFVGDTAATAQAPVTVRGSRNAVIDGGDVDDGYVFHLDGANYWRLEGFTIRNGEKGLMADQTNHAVIYGLTVTQVGHEAVHLRNFSSDNLVTGVTVNGTGRTNEGYGEAIYVGTAESNWDQVTGGRPDNSDRNQIVGNTLGGFTAEGIDVKEGTTGGVLAGNSIDGSSITGDNYADSWIDLKGNGWRVENNTGVNSPLDGIQTHVVVDGWGTGNVISGNTLDVGGPGYGVNIHKPDETSNVVSCSNIVTGAGRGLSNVSCS